MGAFKISNQEVHCHLFKKTCKGQTGKQGKIGKEIAAMNNNNVDQDDEVFKRAKYDLDKIYEDIATGIRIRSKRNWYELGKSPPNIFLI